MNSFGKDNLSVLCRSLLLLAAISVITAASSGLKADTGARSGEVFTLPFTEVSPEKYASAI